MQTLKDFHMKNSNADHWLTTMEAITRYRVGPDSLRSWRRLKGFPEGACRREAQCCYWNTTAIDAWLRKRPIYSYGPRPHWLAVVAA